MEGACVVFEPDYKSFVVHGLGALEMIPVKNCYTKNVYMDAATV